VLVGIAGIRERVPLELQIAEFGVADGLGAELRVDDVTGGPPLPELGVRNGQLTDQGREPRVVGVAG
jgi:hypothetical protein